MDHLDKQDITNRFPQLEDRSPSIQILPSNLGSRASTVKHMASSKTRGINQSEHFPRVV